MTKLRMMLIAGVAMLSLAVAGPAMAGEFVSTGGPTKGTGEEQYLHLGPFKITCGKLTAVGPTGTTPLTSPTFNTELKFSKCTTLAFLGLNPIHLPTKFKTPMDVEYHQNGFVEVGSEFEEEMEGFAKLEGGTIEVKVGALREKDATPKYCLITIPTQTVPKKAIKKPAGEYEDALYSNEEEEVGNHTFTELLIENEWKGIKFEYGGGQCSSFKSSEEERNSGTYTGELLEKIPHGSIEYNEEL
jgi:hypothetical protein